MINDRMPERTFRSAIKVAIRPIHGIKQRVFLPPLQHIVGPASVGLPLNVYSVIAEVSPRPLIANDCCKAVQRAVVRSIDDAVVMKKVIGTDFQNRDDEEALAMPFCTTAQNSAF